MKKFFKNLKNAFILLSLIFSILVIPNDTNTIVEEDYSISTFSDELPYPDIEIN